MNSITQKQQKTALNTDIIHPSWRAIVTHALNHMDPAYLQQLTFEEGWLPGPNAIFNAFTLPLPDTRYILFGESPYPRAASANGYAFWDAATCALWSDSGLDKKINRATSLRHLMKMLLVAGGYLKAKNTSQEAIAALDKATLIQTSNELFTALQQHGILLLNATLVLSHQGVRYDAKNWWPFMDACLQQLHQVKPDIKLILLGKVANLIEKSEHADRFARIIAEHPYNISFINNTNMHHLFKSMNLLEK